MSRKLLAWLFPSLKINRKKKRTYNRFNAELDRYYLMALKEIDELCGGTELMDLYSKLRKRKADITRSRG